MNVSFSLQTNPQGKHQGSPIAEGETEAQSVNERVCQNVSLSSLTTLLLKHWTQQTVDGSQQRGTLGDTAAKN